MHFSTTSPGSRLETLYIAEPASLSLMLTVPAAKLLPLFDVVDVNAENAEIATRAPVRPTTTSVSRTFRGSIMRPACGWTPGPAIGYASKQPYGRQAGG